MKIKENKSLFLNYFGDTPQLRVMDFLIENIKAKKVIEIYSNYFPHSVFINEKNLIDVPCISIYHANS